MQHLHRSKHETELYVSVILYVALSISCVVPPLTTLSVGVNNVRDVVTYTIK